MGITDKMSKLAGNVHQGVKTSTFSLAAMILKIVTGFVIGLTLALIGQEMMGSGTLMFVFTMILTGGLIFKILSSFSLGSVLIFDLICILVALLLRMYILIAP